MAERWPAADADPAASKYTAEFARIWRDMPKIVYSRTLREAGWNATIVPEVVPAEIMELKATPGGDMVLGGADLAETFRRHDLIDEYRIYVHPVLIGQGRPLFQPAEAKRALRLTETRRFGSGVVMLRYMRG
jgi:dihydrofolate reductase